MPRLKTIVRVSVLLALFSLWVSASALALGYGTPAAAHTPVRTGVVRLASSTDPPIAGYNPGGQPA